MAVRDFDGSGDYIDLGLIDVAGTVTYAGVIKRMSNGTWDTIVTHQLADDTYALAITLSDANRLVWAAKNSGGTQSSMDSSAGAAPFTIQASDGWVIWAVRRDAGAGSGETTFSVFKSGAWIHTQHTGSGILHKSAAGGKIRVGRFESTDDIDAQFAALAIWNGTILTNGQIEALDPGSVTGWAAAGAGAPTEHWEFNQASTATAVEGAYNVSDQVAIAGTTVIVGDDPDAGIYTFAAGVNDKSGTAILPGGGVVSAVKQKHAIATHG